MVGSFPSLQYMCDDKFTSVKLLITLTNVT